MRALGATLVAFALLAGTYAMWLLVTDDPDGGRRPVGGLIGAIGALTLVAGVILTRRARS